jgi:iron complex outermembrane receptor protein
MYIWINWLLCCVVLIFSCSHIPYSEAQEVDLFSLSLEQLTHIKITTGTPVAINKAPAVVSLITAEDIKAMGASTINEVLESVPGLHVIPSNMSRSLPDYTIRGLYTGQNAQVMFMLNGYRIYGEIWSSGISFLSRINVNNIARIEIVRGPGSAVYGADAYAGVINIITKTAKGIEGLHLGIKAGSQNTRNLWLQYGIEYNRDWQLALSIEHFERSRGNERSIEHDLQLNFDALFGSSASLAPGHINDELQSTTYNLQINNKQWEFGFNGHFLPRSGNGIGAADAIDSQGYDKFNQHLFHASYQNELSDIWQLESKFSYFYSRLDAKFTIFPANTILPVGNDGNIFTPHDGEGCLTVNITGIGCLTTFTEGMIGNPSVITKIPAIEASLYYKGWKNQLLRLNIGMKEELFSSEEAKNFGPGVLSKSSLNGMPNPTFVNGFLTDVTDSDFIFATNKKRTIKFLSAQNIWDINPNWTLTTGIRYDDYSDFGSTINPRIALVWDDSEQLVTKFLYGEAFRAPSASELLAKNNPAVIGNKNLNPEKIKTTEISFNYTINEKFITSLNLYHFSSKDMIEFIRNDGGRRVAQNTSGITGKGLELEGKLSAFNYWQFTANYAYQHTKDNYTDHHVAFVPKQQFYLDVRRNISSNWLLSSQFNWIFDRKREAGDMRSSIDDYRLVDLSLRRLSKKSKSDSYGWEFAASIKNLFDQKAREPTPDDGSLPNDFPLYGRRFYFELRYNM